MTNAGDQPDAAALDWVAASPSNVRTRIAITTFGGQARSRRHEGHEEPRRDQKAHMVLLHLEHVGRLEPGAGSPNTAAVATTQIAVMKKRSARWTTRNALWRRR